MQTSPQCLADLAPRHEACCVSRNFASPLRKWAVKYLPWLAISREHRDHHERLYGVWREICAAMLKQPTPAGGETSIAHTICCIPDAATGKWLTQAAQLQYQTASYKAQVLTDGKWLWPCLQHLRIQ